MVVYICNALSLSMLDREAQRGALDSLSLKEQVQARTPMPLSAAEAIKYIADWTSAGADVVSAVGHADTAAILGGILGRKIAVNRVSVKLNAYSRAVIGQYVGPRLPEGTTTLPEGAAIEWWIV